MAELKTRKTNQNPSRVIAAMKDPIARRDAETLVALMSKATGATPRMWGTIFGFGDAHLRYASGREVDWFVTGFAVRKGTLAIYLGCGARFPGADALLKRLGTHSMGAGCLWIKRLDEIDAKVLGKLIAASAREAMSKAVAPAKPKSAKRTRPSSVSNPSPGGRVAPRSTPRGTAPTTARVAPRVTTRRRTRS